MNLSLPRSIILGSVASVLLAWAGCTYRTLPARPSGDRSKAQHQAAASADPAPRFSVKERRGRWWLVSPKGEEFFSLGVCCVNQGFSQLDYDPENPGYAAWRYYSNAPLWAGTALRRLKAWGFTTVGAWSDHLVLRESSEASLWLTPVLHMGSTAGAPWWDMWDPAVVRRIDEVARDQIMAVRNDPRLIGYYSDNEIGWWNATLFKMTLEHLPSSGQRQRLIKLLRTHYKNDWTLLTREFQPEGANSWAGLERKGMLWVRPDTPGVKVMRKFLSLVAERYYQLMHDIIRKYDQRALILGDRYQSFFYPEVARAAAPYVDVISSNLNASWTDGTFLRFYFETLHNLTGKPILVSEIYMAATDNRSGNRNTHGLFPVVATQAERAASLRNTLEELRRLPWVIGADWFQYYDEPTHGRFDGENFNFGLVDIHDQPYESLTRVFADWDPSGALGPSERQSEPPRQVIPPGPPDPVKEFEPRTALMRWDRKRGYLKPASEFPMADLYACWTPRALFLGLYALDIVEDAYYRDRNVPKEDRMKWFVRLPGRSEPIRVRLGAGREPLVNDPAIRVWSLSGFDLSVRTIAAIELPCALFGKERFEPGDVLELESTVLTHADIYRMDWKGRFPLSE